MKRFLSGDEALAEGIRLARPQVISAYPITPQTVVVERLSEMVERGDLNAEYVHVESEHSALSCALGASATGARAFTATSSQGLLYMAEVLTYVSGGRFPIVMMNANRATALPWNIYGDQRDSLALLDHGWIQAYAQDNQESLDFALMAYAIAEDKRVRTPFMINLDGFALTHTYELVDVPSEEEADAFLPPYSTDNAFNFDRPVNIGYSAGPEYNKYFKYWAHRDMVDSEEVIQEIENRFASVFGRTYTGLIEEYRCQDAECVVVTLGSVAGLVRQVVDDLRVQGEDVGMIRIRYMRPFPKVALQQTLRNVRSVGVLEKDVSFGAEGTVFTNVASALMQDSSNRNRCELYDFVGGLGGDDITYDQVKNIFETLKREIDGDSNARVRFLGIDDENVSRETFSSRAHDDENGSAHDVVDTSAHVSDSIDVEVNQHMGDDIDDADGENVSRETFVDGSAHVREDTNVWVSSREATAALAHTSDSAETVVQTSGNAHEHTQTGDVVYGRAQMSCGVEVSPHVGNEDTGTSSSSGNER